MRKRLYRVEQFRFYDRAGVERHLAKMAAKGWRLEKITPYFWHYRRAEPGKLIYSVTYFPDASEFDPGPTEGQQTFRDYCEASGWEFVTQWAQMQIFSTERPDAVPIETEESVRLEVTHQAMKKNFLPSGVVLVGLAILQLGMQSKQLLDDPAETLSNGFSLGLILLWLSLLAFYLVNLGGYGLWYRRSKRAVDRGEACADCGGGYRWVSHVLAVLVGCGLLGFLWLAKEQGALGIMALSLVYVALLTAAVYGAKAALKRRKASRTVNRTVTIALCFVLSFALTAGMGYLIFRGVHLHWFDKKPVETYHAAGWDWDIYHDDLPLKVEDLTETDYQHYSYEWKEQSTFLAAYARGGQFSFPDRENAPELSYEWVDVKAGWLYNLCLNQYLEYRNWDPERGFRPTDASAWQADRVYQLYSGEEPRNHFVVCRGRRILQITFAYDWNLTPGQLSIAAEKLWEGQTRE